MSEVDNFGFAKLAEFVEVSLDSRFRGNDKGVRKDNSGFAKLAELLKVSLDSRFRGNDTGVRFTISDSLSLWNLSWFHWIPAFAGMTK